MNTSANKHATNPTRNGCIICNSLLSLKCNEAITKTIDANNNNIVIYIPPLNTVLKLVVVNPFGKYPLYKPFPLHHLNKRRAISNVAIDRPTFPLPATAIFKLLEFISISMLLFDMVIPQSGFLIFSTMIYQFSVLDFFSFHGCLF